MQDAVNKAIASELAQEFKDKPVEQWTKVRYDFMHAGEAISRLPVCNLQNHSLDSFGSLRAWPIWKALQFLLPLTTATVEAAG